MNAHILNSKSDVLYCSERALNACYLHPVDEKYKLVSCVSDMEVKAFVSGKDIKHFYCNRGKLDIFSFLKTQLACVCVIRSHMEFGMYVLIQCWLSLSPSLCTFRGQHYTDSILNFKLTQTDLVEANAEKNDFD